MKKNKKQKKTGEKRKKKDENRQKRREREGMRVMKVPNSSRDGCASSNLTISIAGESQWSTRALEGPAKLVIV